MHSIQKRDGTFENFDKDKIRRSLLIAFDAAGEHDISEINDMIDMIDPLPSTGGVGDAVEDILIDYKYHSVVRHYIVYRNEKARIIESKFDNRKVMRGLEDYIHASKYGKPGETWNDTVDRWASFYGTLPLEIVSAVRDKKLLPSMRSLQFAGDALRRQPERMYNCSGCIIDDYRYFGDILYLLLCGCGVGFNIAIENIEKMPNVHKLNSGVLHYTIDDSIEGWSKAVQCLMRGYYVDGRYVEFNYSKIRPRGDVLHTSGGYAPGHLPLKQAIENIRQVMDGAVGRQLRPIEILDIVCFLGEAVLSGGIRRSSLICLFDDTEVLYAKTGAWLSQAPQRAICNNTMILDDTKHLGRVLAISQFYGEPGFTFIPKHLVLNPCGEVVLEPPAGGFGFCNLVEIAVPRIDNVEEFYTVCRLAAHLATLQRFRCVPRLGTAPDIGVSLTGLMDVEWIWDAEILRRGRGVVDMEQQKIAMQLGLAAAARTCCIKPSGTASLLLGCIGSGIHPHHAARYVRRVVGTDLEPCFRRFAAMNPHMITIVGEASYINWPIEAPKNAKLMGGAYIFMSNVRFVQDNWCNNPRSGLSHNVSCTVTMDDSEREEVLGLIKQFKPLALSFGPQNIEERYPGICPREKVDSRSKEVYWNDLVKGYKDVDYSDVEGVGDRGAACDGEKCIL